ncbi:MAG: hypothetical protein NZ889_00925 [Candidatus Pacearchaeota archaeon]|nr:hypothetical protein [Candidatus Pacearchaeota archaeon]
MNLKLKPSLREKRHYLLIKVNSEKDLDEKEIKEKIKKAIFEFIGILGYANAGPIFIDIEDENLKKEMKSKKMIVLSVTTKFVKHVKAALILSKEKNFSLDCIRVSGTLKKIKDFIKEMKD